MKPGFVPVPALPSVPEPVSPCTQVTRCCRRVAHSAALCASMGKPFTPGATPSAMSGVWKGLTVQAGSDFFTSTWRPCRTWLGASLKLAMPSLTPSALASSRQARKVAVSRIFSNSSLGSIHYQRRTQKLSAAVGMADLPTPKPALWPRDIRSNPLATGDLLPASELPNVARSTVGPRKPIFPRRRGGVSGWRAKSKRSC